MYESADHLPQITYGQGKREKRRNRYKRERERERETAARTAICDVWE